MAEKKILQDWLFDRSVWSYNDHSMVYIYVELHSISFPIIIHKLLRIALEFFACFIEGNKEV